MKTPKFTLPVIVISQFFCTSLWFAGNAIMFALVSRFQLGENAVGALTSVVQFGFIIGTLIFAILSIADRYSPSKVFLICALMGAISNLSIIIDQNTFTSILFLRFLTGFFLAGIYPVGMKIASDYFEKGLGRSLGFLVGALVLGTAFPHLLQDLKGHLPWEFVLIVTSLLAVVGGLLMYFLVPDGPYRKSSQKLKITAIWKVFKVEKFRSSAFGYFGHMWELYTFWAFVPLILRMYQAKYPTVDFNIPLLSFSVIGVGAIACIGAGLLGQKFGVKTIAMIALGTSCCCCILAPMLFSINSSFVFISFLLFWGMAVIADSPLFSTLVAQNAPIELKGTALTIVNSVGFLLTIISIQVINTLRLFTDSPLFLMALSIGPVFGLLALKRNYLNS